jgi:hypothetical protein
MVYNAQDCWVSGLCPSSDILRTQKDKTFQKLDLFPSSGKGGDTYSAGSIRKSWPQSLGVPEKFKHVLNHYGIWIIFRTKHTLRSSVMKTRLEGDLQQMTHCIYSITCECGRPLAVQLCEHRHNLKEGLLEKLQLAQHTYEEGRLGWS